MELNELAWVGLCPPDTTKVSFSWKTRFLRSVCSSEASNPCKNSSFHTSLLLTRYAIASRELKTTILWRFSNLKRTNRPQKRVFREKLTLVVSGGHKTTHAQLIQLHIATPRVENTWVNNRKNEQNLVKSKIDASIWPVLKRFQTARPVLFEPEGSKKVGYSSVTFYFSSWNIWSIHLQRSTE